MTVTGLTAAELGVLTPDNLAQVVRVHVRGSSLAVAGTYTVAGNKVRFVPAFPFDAGREYTIDVTMTAIRGQTRPPIVGGLFSLPVAAVTPSTRVVAVDPTSDTWPANLLRVYLHFSAPMSRESGVGKIVLRDSDGIEVTEAFLPLEADFWSPDHLRYTVFFDPGRVKRGILPNRQRGRALVDGRAYTLEISKEWRDARGQPLADSHRHAFRAGPAVEQPMRVEDWMLSYVRVGTRDPLVVRFPWPIDRGLVERSLAVSTASGQAVAGKSSLEQGDVHWSFIPGDVWSDVGYRLVALPILEDPSGNQIGRAFEVDMKADAPPSDVKRELTFRPGRSAS